MPQPEQITGPRAVGVPQPLGGSWTEQAPGELQDPPLLAGEEGWASELRVRSKLTYGPSGRDVSRKAAHPRRTVEANPTMGSATTAAIHPTYPGPTRPRVEGTVVRAEEEKQYSRRLPTLRMRALLRQKLGSTLGRTSAATNSKLDGLWSKQTLRRSPERTRRTA